MAGSEILCWLGNKKFCLIVRNILSKCSFSALIAAFGALIYLIVITIVQVMAAVTEGVIHLLLFNELRKNLAQVSEINKCLKKFS